MLSPSDDVHPNLELARTERRAAMQTPAARQVSLEIAARQASLETQMDPKWIEAQQASVEIAVRASLQNSAQRNEGAEMSVQR